VNWTDDRTYVAGEAPPFPDRRAARNALIEAWATSPYSRRVQGSTLDLLAMAEDAVAVLLPGLPPVPSSDEEGSDAAE
jgi:hypothetical protein